MDIPRRTKGSGLSKREERVATGQEECREGRKEKERKRGGDAAVCKFLGLARGRDRAGFRGEFAWATHLRPATTFANVLLIALVY